MCGLRPDSNPSRRDRRPRCGGEGLREIVRHFKDHPAVIGYQIDNETAPTGISTQYTNAAFLERLGISAAGFIGWPLSRRPLRIPWDQLDLSDPERPRACCSLEELKKMSR